MSGGSGAVADNLAAPGQDFSDGCYKKFVLDGQNYRIYRRRIDSIWFALRIVGAGPEGPAPAVRLIGRRDR